MLKARAARILPFSETDNSTTCVSAQLAGVMFVRLTHTMASSTPLIAHTFSSVCIQYHCKRDRRRRWQSWAEPSIPKIPTPKIGTAVPLQQAAEVARVVANRDHA